MLVVQDNNQNLAAKPKIKGEQMTASARYRYKQALATCLAAGMIPDAARRMALQIVRASRIARTDRKEANQ